MPTPHTPGAQPRTGTSHYAGELAYWDARASEAYVSLSSRDQLRIKHWIGQRDRDKACLDIGGGSGMAATLLEKGDTTFVTCLDLSCELLRFSPVPSVQADAMHMPFADRSFDLIVAAAFFHHLPGREAEVLRECARVLRPGGRIVGYDPSAQCIQNKIFMGDGPFRLKFFSPDERPIDVARFSRLLDDAGFEPPSIDLFSFRNSRLTVFEAVQRYLLNPLSAGPLRALFQRWFFWSAQLR